MIYNYTTYALETHNLGWLILMTLFGGFFSSIVYGLYYMEKETNDVIAGTKTPIAPFWKFLVWGLASSTSAIVLGWNSPYPNEQVIAKLVESDEAQYKSGKHSYVKGATVTYKLPDGGLVTFRADGGSAWYSEIILYKNPKK